MKKMILALVLAMTAQANAYTLVSNHKFGEVEIEKYLNTKLAKCSLGYADEVFTVTNVQTREHRVDQGIIDVYYTITLKYESVRNDVIQNGLVVEILDADFDNWREYSEKLSFEVLKDENSFCR
nr:hypothetical protein BHI3_18620 [Bacteriovorax sp. HI3]